MTRFAFAEYLACDPNENWYYSEECDYAFDTTDTRNKATRRESVATYKHTQPIEMCLFDFSLSGRLLLLGTVFFSDFSL